VLLALAVPAIVSAQSPAAEVARLEQQRVDAVRIGQGVARFYASAYRGITALGQYEATDQIRRLTANPGYARLNDVAIDVHDETAIVTGIEGSSETDLDRILRI
jgi:hypothetical protein